MGLGIDMGYKHGMHGTPTYYSWYAMRRRCNYEKAQNYPYYGGRGIKVCEQWDRDFSAFFEDMGTRPVGTTLDRKNNNGDYTPENCRWATYVEQRANQKMPSSNKSGYQGVQFHKATKKWRAYISIDRKPLHLGVFSDIGSAIKARKEAELKYWRVAA